MSFVDDYKDAGGLNLKCALHNKVDGDLQIKIEGKNIKIECDAIFKINSKPYLKEKFLSNKGTWIFDRLYQGEYGDDLFGDVSKGLIVKKYKRKIYDGSIVNFTSAIMQNVKTGSKKTDLK